MPDPDLPRAAFLDLDRIGGAALVPILMTALVKLQLQNRHLMARLVDARFPDAVVTTIGQGSDEQQVIAWRDAQGRMLSVVV